MSAMTRLAFLQSLMNPGLPDAEPSGPPDVFTKHGIRTNKNLTSKIMRRYIKRKEYLLKGARPSEAARRG